MTDTEKDEDVLWTICKILITNDTFPYAMQHLTARVGATKRIYFPRLIPDFSRLSKHWLPIEYHVHIWQVSPQLNCCDTRYENDSKNLTVIFAKSVISLRE